MLSIYFFNVGHGDSIAIKFPNNEWGIIDCNKNLYAKEPNVLNFLKLNNIQELNFVCITHPHEDHFYGFDNIISYYGAHNIKKLILYGLKTGHDNEFDEQSSLVIGLRCYLQEIKKQDYKNKLFLIKNNDKFNVGGVDITCLNPYPELIENMRADSYIKSKVEYNNLSVVLSLEYQGIKILLTGDVNGTKIQDQKNLLSDIVKICHHGSKYNNSNNFLNNAIKQNQSYSIVSVGDLYNLPDKDVIGYIKNELNSEVYLTKDLGKEKQEIDIQFELSEMSQNLLDESSKEDRDNIKQPNGCIAVFISNSGNVDVKTYNDIKSIKL